MADTYHEFFVTDSRYPVDRENVAIYFASSNKNEAVRVANEIGINFLVVRHPEGEIVHDAAFHAELPLAF